jgi:hypothetical protein
MEDNFTVESDYREMMKRWLYDFLFEKVIIHAKYLNPVQFSYDLIRKVIECLNIYTLRYIKDENMNTICVLKSYPKF